MDYVRSSWPYEVTALPAELPVSVDDLKCWARIDTEDSSEDAIITMMIKTASELAEKITRRTLITTTYKTLRNGFSEERTSIQGGAQPIVLRRTLLRSITSFTYQNNAGGTTAMVEDTDYVINQTQDYSSLHPVDEWPVDLRFEEPQELEISFTAGYGDKSESIPNALRSALLQHSTDLYSDRGDCSCDGGIAITRKATASYLLHKVMEL